MTYRLLKRFNVFNYNDTGVAHNLYPKSHFLKGGCSLDLSIEEGGSFAGASSSGAKQHTSGAKKGE